VVTVPENVDAVNGGISAKKDGRDSEDISGTCKVH